VTGRTIILIVSIITKNGFSHRGALSGRRWPMVFFGECVDLLSININHIGKLNDSVTIM